MAFLSDTDKQRIEEAVRNAELGSSGEIATAIINESSSYAEYELLFSLIKALAVMLLMLIFKDAYISLLNKLFWEVTPFLVLNVSAVIITLTVVLSYFFFNIPVINRRILPKKVVTQRVHRRALVHFVEAGVIDTENRTGILIFISKKEQRVELIADSGINKVVNKNEWDKIVTSIVEAIKEGKTADGLVQAIDICGKIIKENFPAGNENPNELSNAIVELEE